MTVSAPHHNAIPRWRHLRNFGMPVAGFLLAIVTSALCRSTAGVSLGLFFGGVAFATLLVPPVVAGEPTTRRRLIIPAVVSVGIALIWLTALGHQVTFAQWLACTAALLIYAFALCGVCSLLIAMRVNPVVAPAVVTVLGLLWLTWPVWLSRALTQPIGETLVTWLVPAHPLFAINAVLGHFDTWDRYPLAYSRLTVLNQDIFYVLPTGVLWTTLIHGTIAAATIALTIGRDRRHRDEQESETAIATTTQTSPTA